MPMMANGAMAAPALAVSSNVISTEASGSRSAPAIVAAMTAGTAAPRGNPGRLDANTPSTPPMKIAGKTGPPRKLPRETLQATPP